MFFKVGNSGVEDTPWLLGLIEGRDGVLSFEGLCAGLFLAYLDWGTGGRAEVGGSAVGRERMGKDMFLQQVPSINLVAAASQASTCKSNY